MGGVNCSSVLEENVSSLTEQIMTFLPRRLCVRYLLARERRDRREFFYAEVLYYEGNLSGTSGLLRLKCTAVCDAVLKCNHPDFNQVFADEIGIRAKVSKIISGWRKKVAEHPHFEPWLKPEEFVGVLKIGDEKPREISERDPLFTFYHALLATRLIHLAMEFEETALYERNLVSLNVGLVGRMSYRFSAFAAQNRHISVEAILGE